jgi:hypothetical protein
MGRPARRRGGIATVALALVAACGGEPPAPARGFTCTLPTLQGTWREHLEETSGTCGAVADRLVTFGEPLPAGCKISLSAASPDGCQVLSDQTCPTADGQGQTRQLASLLQTGPAVIRGTLNVSTASPAKTCGSIYDVTFVKQPQ